ncbi:hypothetical protein, partial [Salmonella sp. s60093]|uniref:hypothetical protein n=1 Tax=Salmonella sp. s60093 TaxID=3159721 RepID=UPI0039806F49
TRTLFRTEGLSGTQWYSCELDDEGWGYFGGNQYLIREGIMSAGTPQSNYPGFTNSIFDSILAGNKYNALKYKDNYIYCATNDNITGILRKLD